MINLSTLNNPKHLVTMGRTAPKQMTRATHADLWSRIHDGMRRGMGLSTSYYCLIASYQNRSRYGDLDMLIMRDGLPTDWQRRMSNKVFNGCWFQEVPGTNTTVFEYDGYQVNVHCAPDMNTYSRAQIWLGNQGVLSLVSVLAESLGIEYDLNRFNLRTGLATQELIDIPYNMYSELRVVGVSVDFVAYHIHNENDAFKAILTSAFFNRQVFLDLEAKEDYAERVAKNPSLGRFVTHLKEHPRILGETKFDPTSTKARNEFTHYFRSYAGNTFEQYSVLMKKHKIVEMVGTKFSIDRMAKVTGLEGENLKHLMDLFAQDGFTNEKDFNMYIVTSLPETIDVRILALRDKHFKDGEKIEPPKLEVKSKKAIRAEKSADKVAQEALKTKLKAKRKTKAQKDAEDYAALQQAHASLGDSFALAA